MKTNWTSGLMAATLLTVGTVAWAQDDHGQSESKAKSGNETKIEVDGGKLIIIGKDGKQKEIDVKGAKSIVVTQQSESNVVDGKEKKKVSGRAVIVGPDGETREIELNMPDVNLAIEGKLDELQGHWGGDLHGHLLAEGMQIGKFFIGVQCEPVSDLLRSHLKLEKEIGLVVNMVTPESPAAQAGLAVNDILLYANDTPVGDTTALIDAVNKAGEDGNSLSISIIRSGEEKKVEVKPIERKEGFALGESDLLDGMRLKELMAKAKHEKGMAWLGDLKPGVIRALEESAHAGLSDESVAQLKAHMDQMREHLEKSHHDLKDMQTIQEELKDVRDQMQKAREEIMKAKEELMRSVNELNQKKSGDKDDSTNPST